MEALLGSGARESSILQEASIVDKSDEESADDADKSGPLNRGAALLFRRPPDSVT